MKTKPFPVVLSVILLCVSCSTSQTTANGIPTTLTGILLASDVSNRWALMSGDDIFPLRGSPNQFAKYERQRVTISGTLDAEKTLDVRSIGLSPMPEKQLRKFIEQLKNDGWGVPKNISSPTFWLFDFTLPMQQIIQAGPAAEPVLLQYLNDPQIIDHIVILLGAVGDEKAVEPIIRAMPEKRETGERANKLRLVANLALTNITVSDVIWHHGGGITVDHCPDDPKSCWTAWWSKNKGTFRVSTAYPRNYSNYPNYGIYQSPALYRANMH
ncbi:MAG: hypothetical protein ROO76_20455 [Terriglobia bacterium]|nr:hypothetical protein [Terriglobia bacterium]